MAHRVMKQRKPCSFHVTAKSAREPRLWSKKEDASSFFIFMAGFNR